MPETTSTYESSIPPSPQPGAVTHRNVPTYGCRYQHRISQQSWWRWVVCCFRGKHYMATCHMYISIIKVEKLIRTTISNAPPPKPGAWMPGNTGILIRIHRGHLPSSQI